MRFFFSFNRGFRITLGVWAKVGGFIAAVSITAAAQLWEFPYPRSLLMSFGFLCGIVALNLELWTTLARAVLPPEEDDAKLLNEVIVAVPMMLFLVYVAVSVPDSLIPKTRALMACANFPAPEICTTKSASFSNDKATK